MSISSTKQLNGHEKPPNHSQISNTEGSVLPENRYLPCTSTKIKLWPLQLLNFNNPWKESGWTSGLRHSVIWNSERAGQEIDNFWRRLYEPWFLHLVIPRKTQISLTVTFVLAMGQIKIKSQIRPSLVVQYFKNLSANPEDTSSMPDLGRSHILHSKVSAFTTDVEPCSRAWNFNFWAQMPQILSLNALQPVIHKRCHHNEKPTNWN